MKTGALRLNNSFSLWEKASRLIPNGTQSFSKGPTQFSFGVCPVYLKSGRGAKVVDVDDNEYIDYGMGLHSAILGYSHQKVTEAVTEGASNGINLTLMHPLEVEVSEILKAAIPSAQRVRFTKAGSEATSAAIRIARAVTGRDHIAVCGYHGWHDWFIAVSERADGIPNAVKELTHKFSYNQIETLESLLAEYKGKMAAVIMEPCGIVPPKDDFLKKCGDLARKAGALFIFDEIITGIRWNEGGAQALFGVTPDLSTFGKTIANGMPISAVVGKAEYMDILNKPEVFFSSTFAGEIVSLSACKATMKIVKEEKVIPFIWEKGKRLTADFNKLAESNGLSEFMEMVGFPCRPVVSFKNNGKNHDPLLMKSFMQQECAKRGLLFTGYFAMSFAHDDKIIDSSLDIFDDVFKVFKAAVDGPAGKDLTALLEGKVVSPVFRKL